MMATLERKSKTLELPDLPENWEKKIDMRTGLPFFLNHTDKFTTWDDPRLVTEPRGMINPLFRQASPTPARSQKTQPSDDFFKPTFDDDFFKQGFTPSTLSRGRRGLSSRFVDMDPWFHQTDRRDEPDCIPDQPMFSTLGRRNHRMKPKQQQDDPPPQNRRRFGYSEPPCEERLYGKSNRGFEIPVNFHSTKDTDEAKVIPPNESRRRSPIHHQQSSQKPIHTRRASEQEPQSQTYRKFLASKLSEPTIQHQSVPSNFRKNSPIHVEESFHVVDPDKTEEACELQSQHTAEESLPDIKRVSETSTKDEVQVTPESRHLSEDESETSDHEIETTGSDSTEQLHDISTETQSQHQKQVQAAFDKIKSIRGQVDEYKLQISDFTGGRDTKEFRYLNEMLTRATLALDTIDSLGEIDIRRKRKEVVRYIDLCTDQLESKCQ